MSLAKIDWAPDAKTLRTFSEAWMFFLGMLAAPGAYFQGRPNLAALLWVAAVLGRLVGAVRPAWLKPLFLGMSVASWPIGWIIGHAAMLILYGLVVTPIGWLVRRLKGDPLARAWDAQASTYWEAYRPDRGLDRYLKPY